MKNIYLNGLNNTAPTELCKTRIKNSMMVSLLRSYVKPELKNYKRISFLLSFENRVFEDSRQFTPFPAQTIGR